MRFRRFMWGALPAMLMAISLLAPGLHAARRPHPVKHHARKAHLHVVARRHATHSARRRVRRWHRRRYIRYRYRSHPSRDRIEQIQRALVRGGFYQGDPSGRWDSSTIDAMKSFQQAHGLEPTGKIDAKSLQQLGLGSDVAGLAPPRPLIAADRSGTSD